LKGASPNGVHDASSSPTPGEYGDSDAEILSIEEFAHGDGAVPNAEEVDPTTDYMADEFCWSEAIVEESRDTFGIDEFRSCQLGYVFAQSFQH
jgi:hypothetical protein